MIPSWIIELFLFAILLYVSWRLFNAVLNFIASLVWPDKYAQVEQMKIDNDKLREEVERKKKELEKELDKLGKDQQDGKEEEKD